MFKLLHFDVYNEILKRNIGLHSSSHNSQNWYVIPIICLNPYSINHQSIVRISQFSEFYLHVRGVIKKFVYWCNEINRYLATCMFTHFIGDIKQHIFYQLWKCKLDMLIIDNFINKYILYGMVTRRSLRWVLWRFTISLLFHLSLCTLIHFRPSREVKYQFTQFFLHEYQMWRIGEWNWQCYSKRRV